MATRPRMKDAEVITAFVAWFASGRAPGLRIDRWPDRERRDGSDIDAVAGPFAIEHTSVDAFSEQRKRSAWLDRVVAGLEDEIPTSKHLYIVFHYYAIQPGQDWGAIRNALRVWLSTEGQQLMRNQRIEIPGVPFAVDVYVMQMPASVKPRVSFGRYTNEHDVPLSQRLRGLCDRKVEKLAPYKENGKTTLLLIENDDVANMNHVEMAQAVLAAYPQGRPAGVDEVWYVSTILQPELHILDLSSIWSLDETLPIGIPTIRQPPPR